MSRRRRVIILFTNGAQRSYECHPIAALNFEHDLKQRSTWVEIPGTNNKVRADLIAGYQVVRA